MDATTSDIPREVADIIVDLDIIGRIPTNHKLNTLDKTYVDADSKIDAFWRMWNGESGDTTVDFINATIDRAINICRNHKSWTENIALRVESLSNALINLEQIYKRKKQESTVGKLELVKIRISRDRFLRACHAPRALPQPIMPIYNSQPIHILSTTPPDNNPHTGLTPILNAKFSPEKNIDNEV